MTNLFIRHGEVENIKNIQYANIPGFHLSKNGIEQAQIAALKIKNNFNIKKIVSSPLLRARETSSIINSVLNVEIEYSTYITEWQGPINWVGLTFNEISKTKNYKIKKLDLNNVSEKLNEVYERVHKIYNLYENTIFVTHQDTIRAFSYFYLGHEEFNNFRPNHCEIQEIKEDKINIY